MTTSPSLISLSERRPKCVIWVWVTAKLKAPLWEQKGHGVSLLTKQTAWFIWEQQFIVMCQNSQIADIFETAVFWLTAFLYVHGWPQGFQKHWGMACLSATAESPGSLWVRRGRISLGIFTNTEGLKVPYMKHHFNHTKCPILNHSTLTSDFLYSFEYVELGWVQSWSFSMLVTVNNSNKKDLRDTNLNNSSMFQKYSKYNCLKATRNGTKQCGIKSYWSESVKHPSHPLNVVVRIATPPLIFVQFSKESMLLALIDRTLSRGPIPSPLQTRGKAGNIQY